MTAHLPPENSTAAIGVLLFDGFSNLCLANTLEPLRAGNEMAGFKAFEWRVVTRHGGAVTSSSGIEITADGDPDSLEGCDIVLVISSFNYRRHADRTVQAVLRRLRRAGVVLGGLDTGSYMLASAGLLDGYRATIHWEEAGVFTDEFPRVEFRAERIVVDRDRMTAGGATSAMDLMLTLIRKTCGEAVALGVAGRLLYAREPSADVSQWQSASRTLIGRSPRVATALAIMAQSIDEPLPIPRIAALCTCSQRALERSFAQVVGETAARYYLNLRLSTAHGLVGETDLPIVEIAARTGFSSAGSLIRAYGKRFATTPAAQRRALRRS